MNTRDETLEELNKDYGNTTPSAVKQAPLSLDKAILSYEALSEADLPEREKILPWLPEGGLIMVSAERGLGKTHFALTLACAISNGTPFMKWDVSNPHGVLYVDGEMALSDIRNRLNKITAVSTKKTLQILSHEYFYEAFERDLAITDHDIQTALLALLDSNKSIRVVILDNLSALAKIREDASDDWRNFMLPLLIACRRRGVAVVLIHHCNKNGFQRGTGAREDHLDTSIQLKRLDNEPNNEGCRFEVTFTKSRGCYGSDIENFIASLKQSENFCEWEISTLNESTKDRLIRLVSEHADEGISVTEAANELGVSKGLISRFKKDCEQEGIFQYVTGKHPMKIAINWQGKK
jgi:putative DNA primase/helicase